MRGLFDYHTHTRFSDAVGMPEDCVARAAALGLAEVGVSDHWVPPACDEYGIGANERLDEYAAEVRAAADRHPEIRVLLGIEVDYTPDTRDQAAALLADGRFDYAIGSVHFVDGFAFDGGDHRDDPRWEHADAVWRGYFETLRSAAGSGLFTLIGHFDLPKQFGSRPSDDVLDTQDAALAAVAAAGTAIEVNTSGWRKPVGEAYPSLAILRRARAAGIPLTLGSDAHRPDEVGHRFADALVLAREAGYTSLLRLSDRREVPLP